MSQSLQRLGVIGGGAWGTALALLGRRARQEVTLWAYEPEVVDAINRDHRNPVFLPGVELDPEIRATADLAAAAAADALILAVPAQHLRSVAQRLVLAVPPGLPVIICAKGIERTTLKLMSEVVRDVLPGARPAVLSGPTFAGEVARGLPTAVTLAAEDEALGAALAASIGNPRFRPYLSSDLIGTQVGGAVKNVLAIACGIVEGRRLGDNARAALMTRGLAEVMRLGAALGARRETLMGLSGLGDLVLTCNSDQSRNMGLGIALGEGTKLADHVAGRRSVAEGVDSAQAIGELGRRRGLELPIVDAVDAILHRFADIDVVIESLLARPFRTEI
jgi:glycerol-3-phosphate dehydrogenase (NAD(P)+)